MEVLEQHIEQTLSLERAYKRLFESEDGRLVLAHLAKVGNISDCSFVPGSPDVTAFNEGRRHLVLSILRMINKDPFRMAEQLKET